MILNAINIFRLNKFLSTILFLIISLGVYFCFRNKYGWDWDTYTMIETYLSILEDGKYLRSRGAGYIVPEIGLGFLSYYLGSFAANLTTFLFLIIGLIFLYKSFSKVVDNRLFYEYNEKKERLIFFLLICLTNHVVFRDSTIPIDFSWSFIFYSLGFYFITKKKIELSIIFFSLCFGSRFNYIVFILPSILLLSKSFIDIKKKILICFIIITYGGLFYLPSWLQARFSLDFIFSSGWFSSNKADGVFTITETIRFIYKTVSALGLLFLLSAVFAFFFSKNKILIIFKYFKIPILLIFVNLILFFFFPWEPSYLWILIFSINFIFVLIFSKIILYFLILINIFNWFFQFNIIEVNYLTNGCYRVPTYARFNLHFDKGILLNIAHREEHAKCYPDIIGKNLKILKYKIQLINGQKLFK
jgi:hypothetical protein